MLSFKLLRQTFILEGTPFALLYGCIDTMVVKLTGNNQSINQMTNQYHILQKTERGLRNIYSQVFTPIYLDVQCVGVA